VPLFVKTIDDASTKVVSDLSTEDFLFETLNNPTFFGLTFLDGVSHTVAVLLGHMLRAAIKSIEPYLIIFAIQPGDHPIA
jgi:hypothetical protein